MKFNRSLAFLSFTLILLSNITDSFAATKTWVGITTNWNSDSNWNPAGLPGSSDDVLIPTSPAGGNMPAITTGSSTIKSLNINSGATLNHSDGSLLVDGNVLSISGTYNMTGGFFFIDNKSVTINAGGQLSVSGSAYFHMAKDLSSNPQKSLNINGTLIQNGGSLNLKDLTIGSGAIYTLNGTTLDITGDFTNSGSVSLNSGVVNIKGKTTNNASADFFISGASVTAQDDAINFGTWSVNTIIFDLNTANKKIKIDAGTFTQTGGIVSTKDMEIKNGGTYNQTAGELQISHDLKVKNDSPNNTFNATGGTVHFTGEAGGGSDYTGNVQFHNVVIDAGADYNSDNNSDNIKISGDFTNNNPDLDNDKGTVTFNGTSPQTIYSASTPPGSNTTFGNLLVSNSNGVTLLSDLGIKTSINFSSGGYVEANSNTVYLDGSVYNGPLPVELSSFSAVVLGNGIKLKWKTETEISNYGFEIHRSTQTNDWNVIGFVAGHGNSNSPKDYFYIDESAASGKYSYRLKQIDTDGKFEYSKVIEVDLGSPINYELSQNYPNPFNPSTTIRFSVSENSLINLTIFNSLGEKVEELVNELKEPGVYTVEFNAKNYPSGTYLYRIQSGNFSNTKKMILVK